MKSLPTPLNDSRVGFHFFPDTIHFREIDISTWLPKIQVMNASWLIIESPQDRAIPEAFITTLISHNIEPIIHFNIDLTTPPSVIDIKLLLDNYAKWGVHYVMIFDRPNVKTSWAASSWAQNDLVERFLDRFIPIATAVQQVGLFPVFPPLEPGGDYWDTAFLKSVLESLKRRGKSDILDNLVLTAVAAFSEKGLNWGAGGPERWSGARPYLLSDSEEDQRGFCIYDWYNAISRSTLQKVLPLILVQLGERTANPIHTENYLSIFQLLNNETVNLPGSVENKMDPLPDNVLACAFHLVAQPADNKAPFGAFYDLEDQPTPVQTAVIQWLNSRKNGEKTKNDPLCENIHPLQHYLLLPAYEWGISEWHLDVIKPFVKRHLPTIGFSLSEAALATKITVVGGPQSFSEESLQYLRDLGCTVERISGDGTSIASQLAER